MPNEVIFFLILSIDLALILFAFRLGKEWLFAAIAANMIIVNFTSSLLIPLFGFVASAAAVTYAAIFLATDILTEHYGKKEGYKSVWIAFTMTLLFVVITQLVLSFDSISDTASLSESMRKALEASPPELLLAGLTAYLVAQNFDIWFYHLIHSKTGPRLLWLRNNLSTMVSQAIDSVIFFSIAFVGVLPFVVIVQLIITGYVAKLVVAVIDTPFVYLSYLIKKK